MIQKHLEELIHREVILKKMKFIFITILLCSLIIYGQKKNPSSNHDMDFFSHSVNKLLQNQNKNIFQKTFGFYVNKEFDSCYLYSNKAFLTADSQDEKDVLNYIQGISALEKKMFKKSIYNFLQIRSVSEFNELELRKGYTYFKLKRLIEAITSFKKYENNPKKKDENLKSLYHNLGTVYIHQKKFRKANKYLSKALENLNKSDTTSIINLKIDFANTFYNQYLDDKAIPLFKEVYDLAKGFSNLDLKLLASRNMAVVEKNRKKYAASLKYYEEFVRWKDTISNRDRIWELTEKDKKLAVAQKQQEIAVQDEKLKRQKVQRDGLIIGASGLLIFLGGLGFFYKKLQSQNKFITKQKEALNAANKTKDYLFSVVSHDLRSPINTIKYQHEQLKEHIAANDLTAIAATNDKAIVVTESTSHLLNNVLHWSLEQSNQLLFSPQEIALRPTVEHVLFDYKNLVQANNITIDSALENALVKADKESIKIVLRNVLDNAVKYGGEEIYVTTGVSSNEYAFIEIKDTGVGISKEQLLKINSLTNLSIDKIDRSEGIGLGVILCHTLVKKNNGVLTFASEPNEGTTVTIELPNIPV